MIKKFDENIKDEQNSNNNLCNKKNILSVEKVIKMYPIFCLNTVLLRIPYGSIAKWAK